MKREFEAQNERISVMDMRINTEANKDLEQRLTELERNAHGNDLIINGIPTSAVNLHSTYEGICNAIGFDYSSANIITNIFRLRSGAVILKFQTHN